MKLISLKCPNCNSNIYIDDDKDRCFCSHCGAQILLDNPNDKKITYTTIDVARIKEAETYADIRKRELDLEKERLDREAKRERSRSIAKIITILIALCGFVHFSSNSFYSITKAEEDSHFTMLVGRNNRKEDQETFKRLAMELANQFYYFGTVLIEDIFAAWLDQKKDFKKNENNLL